MKSFRYSFIAYGMIFTLSLCAGVLRITLSFLILCGKTENEMISLIIEQKRNENRRTHVEERAGKIPQRSEEAEQLVHGKPAELQ